MRAGRSTICCRNYTDLVVESDDNMHIIAVRGSDDIGRGVEEAVKKLDTPPLDFELTVYLISSRA